MNKDELEKAIFEIKDLEKFADCFSYLTEKERKALSTHANKIRLQVIRQKANKDASEIIKNAIDSTELWGSLQKGLRNSFLACYALCPLSKLKGIGDGWAIDLDCIEKIIVDRKPSWINDLLAYDLNRENTSIRFPMIRKWVQKDICKVPTADGYYRQLVEYMLDDNRNSKDDNYLTISQRIIKDKELLEDIYQLFHVEHDAFSNFYIHYYYEYPKPQIKGESWSDAIIILVDENLLDRQRVLNEILDGLHNDIKQNQLSGMHKLFDRLKPTIDELNQRNDKLIALLSHKVGHVVKFALKNLTKLTRADKLENNIFLNEVPAVFNNEAKGNAMMVLKLLTLLLKKQPSDTHKIIHVLIAALQHANTDVQSLSLDLLLQVKTTLNDEHKIELETTTAYINSSLKSKLQQLIDKPQAETNNNRQIIESKLSAKEISEKIAQIDPKIRVQLGLDNIDFSQADLAEIKPINPNLQLLSAQESCQEIIPINDVDTLIQVISSAVEGMNDFNDFERILDGLSRLVSIKDDEFEEKTAPLLHRLGQNPEKTESMVAFWSDIRVAFGELLLTWLTNKKSALRKKHYYIEYETLMSRLENLQKRILKKQIYPLLAAPTHENGWIEPQIWVQRIKNFQDSNLNLDRHDFCQSVMRLMPENTSQALKKAKNLSGDLGRVVRFALGEKLNISAKDKKDYDLWITAARCFAPEKDWSEEFKIFKLKNDFPGGVQATKLDFEIIADEDQDYAHFNQKIIFGKDNKHFEFEDSFLKKLHLLQKLQNNLSWNEIPTVAIYRHDEHMWFWSYNLANTWMTQWMFSLWPSYLAPITAIAIKNAPSQLDTKSSNMTPVYGCFQGLFQCITPFSELEHLLLFLGLNAIDQDAKLASIDAYIEALDTCKFNEMLAIAALEKLIKAKHHIKFNRLADNFKQIIPISTLHAYSISQVLQVLLCRIDLKLRNLFHLTEVLLEIHSELQIPLQEDCKKALSSLKGSSKITKIAKKLILMDFPIDNLQQFKLQMIESRLNMLTS